MTDHRDLLQQLETEQQRAYDTTVVTLSGGALGVSFAFVKEFLPATITHHGLLLSAWYCWACSITAILISHFVSVEMLRTAMRELDANKRPKRARWLDVITAGLNVAGGVFFVAGVILLALFVGNNWGKSP